MDTAGTYEANTHLSELLERVSKGERITISRHGVPVAILQPVKSGKRMSVKEAICGIKELRKGNFLRGASIKEMIEEGRD